MHEFEVFTKRATPTVSQPLVTMQRGGMLSLNAAAWDAMGTPDAVELLFDRWTHTMGLRPTEPGRRHAYRVRKQSAGSGVLVSCRAFTQHYGIPTEQACRYAAEVEDGVLSFALKTRTSRRDDVLAVAEWGRNE